MSVQLSDSLLAEEVIQAASRYLLHLQHAEGYWMAWLETNVTMEAEYVFLLHCMGRCNRDREQKLVRHILAGQTEEGAWTLFPGGPGDLNCTVEAYLALKMLGMQEQHEPLAKARNFIQNHGGVECTRVFTRMWLALLGLYPWKSIPVVPVEMMFLPRWAPLNIYDFASWARSTMVPLSIVMSRRPVFPLENGLSIDELFVREQPSPPLRGEDGWERFFRGIDELLHLYQRFPFHIGRKAAEQKAIDWILRHQERDGNWAGIQPAWFYSLLALKVVGMEKSEAFRKGWEALETFGVETDDGRWWFHACISPTWDTGLSVLALTSAGLPSNHPSLLKAGNWLLQQQIFVHGDWKIRRPKAQGGGWAFEFMNDCYPDLDDTAVILMALSKLRLPDEERRKKSLTAGFQWMTAMQSKNGGWAAFDADNITSLPCRIPFCDFGAVTDPPSEDVTAHVLECYGMFGYDEAWHVVRRGVDYLKRTQQTDGSWFGRWGVNYIYGTGAVLPALASVGVNMKEPWVQRALDWLTGHQNEDGGWGESCLSYADPAWIGRGESTPSQTAWALIGLVAGGRANTPAATRAVAYLRNTQRSDGGWDETLYTGTGFPQDFFIGYRLYAHVFPLIALGRYKQALEKR
ncbi:squalene--hopene cyclase [Alicyclobacillus tolerans]|uniref:Squalene-hopene/tetraprenyl-beta-curcumene cyclase n=1 Tax=Alicyclobacillus tolerans TaxID=90970 RepID=A0ABT9LT85_9BACL|nr:squalene--hopene cyclase [Alicyclobacillus tengchongensis]MDP9727481.1 squalene-hopene/tetraprenyl-beta-curcumene cyclase [Alicyclobacillus tengchongensis]